MSCGIWRRGPPGTAVEGRRAAVHVGEGWGNGDDTESETGKEQTRKNGDRVGGLMHATARNHSVISLLRSAVTCALHVHNV
jgi:hypothetical protein